MNLKSFIVGVVTGIVFPTIVGVAVYQITQVKTTEDLIYFSQSPVSFSGQSLEFTTKSITVANIGNISSENVVVSIAFKSNIEIQDSKIEFSSGAAANYTSLPIPPKEKGSKISIPSFSPDETVTLTYLVKGKLNDNPIINVKSSKSIGRKDIQALIGRNNESPNTQNFTLIFIGILGIFSLVYAYYVWKLLIKYSVKKSLADPQNTAFLLLHQELYDDAIKILEEQILNHPTCVFALSNLAVCLAMNGNQDTANKYLCAAKNFLNGSMSLFLDSLESQ